MGRSVLSCPRRLRGFALRQRNGQLQGHESAFLPGRVEVHLAQVEQSKIDAVGIALRTYYLQTLLIVRTRRRRFALTPRPRTFLGGQPHRSCPTCPDPAPA